MGFWSLLADIARVVVPHAAPHVAKGIVDAAKERMGTNAANRNATAVSDEVSQTLAAIQDKLSAIEEKLSAAEARALAAEAENARQQERLKIWLLVLLGWNLVLTIVVIYLSFFRR
jgi:hypothetical protein